MDKQAIINTVTPILQKYPIKRASFFGSYARGDYTNKSDIDIIVEFFIDNVGLMFFSLREDLVNVLPMQLDLIYKPGLVCMEQDFQDNIEREEHVFYEKDS